MNIEYKILRREEINNLIRRTKNRNSERCGDVLFHGTNFQSLTTSEIEIKKMFEICNYIKDIINKYLAIHFDYLDTDKSNCELNNKPLSEFNDYGDICVTNDLHKAVLYCTNDFGERGKLVRTFLDLVNRLDIKLDDDRLNKYLFYYNNHIYRYHQAQKVIIIFQNIGYMDMKMADDGNSIELSKIKPLNDQLMIDTLKLEEDNDQTAVGLVVLEKDFDLLIDVVGNKKEKNLLKDKH